MATDVLVIGGGAIGVAAAYELARDGAQVTLVEKGSRLASGCSAGNAGLLCPSHSAPLATPRALRQGIVWALRRDSPLYLKPRPAVVPWLARFAAASTSTRAREGTAVIRSLSQASLVLHAALAEAGIETGFERRGVLNAYETEPGFSDGSAEASANAKAGLRVEVLEGDEARQLEPALSSAVRGAAYYLDEAHCDPARFVAGIGTAAEAHGARIETDVEVLGFRAANGRLEAVETTGGRRAAATFVLAAGAWTRQLARLLGIYLPIEGGKGYHVELEPGERAPRVPVFMQESRVIATPYPARLRLAGTLELAGLDLGVDPVRVGAILAAARRNVRGLDGLPVTRVWRGLRPCAPDGLPVVGRPRRLENVLVATGHAMMGLTLAPITAKLVAELAAGRSPSYDVAALAPDRFRPLLPRRTLRSPATRPRAELAAPGR
ncbi:MAG: FAD-dependent oxidoreductase [Actinomycetota bacterium]|nr:FAD-dependent oxidoreductase [Actinomycetota bacterium]